MARHTDHAGSPSAADASVPKRGPGRPKGTPASEKQKAAGKENVKKAHVASRERAEARALLREEDGYKPRWKQLEDGDIDVSALSDKELYRRQVANDDGTFTGRRHALTPRLVGRMESELVRRMRVNMSKLSGQAFRALRERLDDNEAPAQQFAAAKMVIEYGIGKVPDVVHLGTESEWDRLQQSGFVTIMRGSENVVPDEGELDRTGQPPAEAELVEEDRA